MTTLAELAFGEKLKTLKLPAIPQILAKLLGLCREDNAGIAELAALIRQDPALTVRILNVASGEMYRRAGAMLNLEQSLMAIGTNMVKTILISEAVYQAFEPLGQSANVDLRPFWSHALSAALTAQEAAAAMAYPRPEEAYLAGLLHDIGRLALLCAAPAEYGDYFHLPDEDSLPRDELNSFGIEHAGVGAALAESWRFDSFVADAIRYHHEHETRLAATHPLLRIVALAHCMGGRARSSQRVLASAALCGLRAEQLERIEKRVRENSVRLARHLGIDPAAMDGAPPRLPPLLSEPDPARMAITTQMQDMALSSELSRCFTGMDAALPLPDAVARSACILFGFSYAAVLGVDKHERALKTVSRESAPATLAEFSIPIASNGRVAEALLRRQVSYLDAGEAGKNIFEEQLCRLLKTRHLVSVPITGGDVYYGVLVGAVDEALLPLVQRRGEMLRLFGEHANRVLREVAPGSGGEAQDDGTVEKYRQRAREIAHEVNNPLSIIRNYLSVLDRKIAKSEPVNAEIAILQDEIDRAANLLQGLNDVGAPALPDHAAPAAVLGDVVRLLRDAEVLPAAVELRLAQFDPALLVACDAGALKQIFLNLLKNAAEALPGSGHIDVGNDGFTSWDSRLCIAISVRDDGPGIPPEVQGLLFSPVATSKGGDHKGLGLSIVHGLVKKAEGRITCRTGPDGTVFQLLLPVSAQSGKLQNAGNNQIRA